MYREVPTLSFILLTHATTAHLGAFAHCCKHFPLFTRIPIYATTPVISLGRTLLQDLYASTPLASTVIPREDLSETAYPVPSFRDGNPNILLQAPTPDEIAGYFSLIHQLKYSQPHQPLPSPFSPPLGGLTITAYNAGHTLGGTIWHIQHGLESVVYAVDWNQAREHVLSGAAWLGGAGTGGSEVLEQLRRPTALICSSRGSGQLALAGGRNKRDEALLVLIRETIGRGASVLIPTDSSARVLELAYLLEETLRAETATKSSDSTLKSAKFFLASRTAGATMRFARSLLEWMEEGVEKEFEAARDAQDAQEKEEQREQQRRGKRRGPAGDRDDDNAKEPVPTPFDFRHITFVERRSQVNRALSTAGPKVIIASDTSLEWGFSKDAMKSLASDANNLVILTERVGAVGREGRGLGRYLWELWNDRDKDTDTTSAAIVDTDGREFTLHNPRTLPLEGAELPLYQQYLARQRQLQTTLQGDASAPLETSADVVDDRSSSTSTTSEDSDIEHQGKALNTAATLAHARHKLGLSDAELGVNILIRRKNVHDYEVRGKKGREKVFPYVSKRRRVDDFGDLIRPEEFVLPEERDQKGGQDMRGDGSKKKAEVGQKRKWDEAGVRDIESGRRVHNGTQKRRRRTSDTFGRSGDPDTEHEFESDSSDEELEQSTHQVEGPSKIILETETLQLNCRVTFVDFSGLHDRRSIQMLVPLIKPRKLILIAGGETETAELAEDCRRLLDTPSGEQEGGVDVFTPVVGYTIDASVDTNAWTVKLSQSMAKRLRWQKVKGLGVVAITGQLQAATLEEANEDEAGASKKQKTGNGDVETTAPEPEVTPILDVIPANMTTSARSVAQPFHVGDLRLADLRKIMQSSGMTAEFRGEGTLVINGTVAVRKTGTGKIEIDGGAYSMSDPRSIAEAGTFFKVKRKIYDGLAVVAGG